jgi:hypothetical protein
MLSCCFFDYSIEALWFGESSLERAIPSEIGELTHLSEYARMIGARSVSTVWWLILMVHF